MTNTFVRRLGSAFLMLALSFAANATYHLFRITQVYSNADGTVQYVLLTATSGGQQYITGKNIKSSQGSVTRTFTFTKDLPDDTAMTEGGGSDGYGGYYGGSTTYRTFLIATQGFASLGLLTPDYIVPDGFLFTSNGTINYADGADLMNYSSLPTDGVTALNRGGSTSPNVAQNFMGTTISIGNSDFASYEGLWLGSNAGEAGWGLNLTHQGSTLFGTWFTYDTDGSGMWLVMSNGARTGVGAFSGTLYRTTGPAFSAGNFTSITPSNYTQVGTLTLTFSNTNTGTMSYTVNGVTQSKPISRYVYVATPPTCMLGQASGSAPNYQDLWWRSTESGWGMNITHQGDILFATWFTYEAGAGTTNKGLWLVMSNGVKTANGVYTGDLQRTTGPAFSAVPFNGNNVVRTTVGTGTFTFTDANNGVFSYTVNGVTQSKPITRLSFSSPATICR